MDPYFADRSTLGFIGNPDLNPEVDISYELGLKSAITSNDALNITAFWKDKYDFITSSTILIPDATGREVAREHAAILAALHLRVDRRHAGRPYDRVSSDRCARRDPAGTGPPHQALAVGKQRPVHPQVHDLGTTGSGAVLRFS